jgi:hypothetical protein
METSWQLRRLLMQDDAPPRRRETAFMSQTNTDTIPSMLPSGPPPQPLYVVRLKLKLREMLDDNRRLQRELMQARQELQAVRLKLRRRAT